MGFRIRKSINLGGGARITFSKSGVGYSWGGKGFRFTKTATGRKRSTAYIPGTGISYVTESSGKKKRKNPQKQEKPVDNTPITLTDIICFLVFGGVSVFLIDVLINHGFKAFLIALILIFVAVGVVVAIFDRK